MKIPFLLFTYWSPQPRPLAHSSTKLRSIPTTSIEESLSSSSLSSLPKADDKTQDVNKIRPLHQNWFPVSITTALKSDRPNAIELLSQKLVLYQDGGEWKCLADRCAHRFAPLSEGRLVSRKSGDDGEEEEATSSSACQSCSIQCAYHGWEFDSTGSCTNIPQYSSSFSKNSKFVAKPVPAFPCREESGMIWVWADPDTATWDLADSITLPISPLVRRAYDNFGADACFMRDLPYGMELLGENLLDLAHLPFSHHGVGTLKRELGGELSLRMMNEEEKTEYSKWEEDFLTEGQTECNVPLLQAEVLNATDTDPIFIGTAIRFPGFVAENANSTISFFEPCHIRYRRERLPGQFGHVEIFMSPTSGGQSRVFLWNTIHKPEVTSSVPKKTFKSRLAKLSPMAAMKKAVLAKLMNPASAYSHSISNTIFDGDGIFLHYQGRRMHESDLTFRDYSTPSSSDILLNAFRRYLDSAAKSSTNAAAKTVSYKSGAAYQDDLSRAKLLDRYDSHTKHCNVCRKELERSEKQQGLVNIGKTALVGAGGASTVTLIASLFLSSALPASSIARAAAMSLGASFLGYKGLSKKESSLERKIRSFKYEDYIHADKN